MHLPLFVEVLYPSLFWYALLFVLSSFAIILTRKKGELVPLLLLSSGCLVTVNILWFFLTVPKFVIVVFPGHTHLFFYSCQVSTKLYARYMIIW